MTSEGKSRSKVKQQSFDIQQPYFLNQDKFGQTQTLFELNSKNVKKQSKPKFTNLMQRKKSINRQFINTAEFEKVSDQFEKATNNDNENYQSFRTARLMCLKSMR